LIDRARTLVGGDDELPAERGRQFIRSVLIRVQIHTDRIDLTFSQNRLASWFDGRAGVDDPATTPESEPMPIMLSISAALSEPGSK
jgi:hypothetical protein